MAVLVRCLICPSSSSDVSRCLPAHPTAASDKTRFSEDVTLLSHQRRKATASYSKVSTGSQVPFGVARTLSTHNYIPYIPATFMTSKREEGMLRKMSAACPMIMECISDHQNMASLSFSRSLIVANALIFTLPFEALAETCEPNKSFFNMPFLFTIALIGATVGGLLARQRKGELRRLNDQLRQINEALRRQAKIESYAPKLSYAPAGGVSDAEIIEDPEKEQLITNLRAGKNFLRKQDPDKAFLEFKTALDLAKNLGNFIEEKKAARGIGASLQRQGNYTEAIKYHSKVLEIAKRSGENSGCTEAYGAIADCYTELGDLERAGEFYDKYIARLTSD